MRGRDILRRRDILRKGGVVRESLKKGRSGKLRIKGRKGGREVYGI